MLSSKLNQKSFQPDECGSRQGFISLPSRIMKGNQFLTRPHRKRTCTKMSKWVYASLDATITSFIRVRTLLAAPDVSLTHINELIENLDRTWICLSHIINMLHHQRHQTLAKTILTNYFQQILVTPPPTSTVTSGNCSAIIDGNPDNGGKTQPDSESREVRGKERKKITRIQEIRSQRMAMVREMSTYTIGHNGNPSQHNPFRKDRSCSQCCLPMVGKRWKMGIVSDLMLWVGVQISGK